MDGMTKNLEKKIPEKLKFFSGFNAGSLKVIMWTRICDGKRGVKNRGATEKNRTVKTVFDRNIRFLYIFGLPRGIGFCGHVQKFAGFWLIVTEQKCVTNSRFPQITRGHIMWVTFCDKTGHMICDETCLGAKVGTRTKISIARVQKTRVKCGKRRLLSEVFQCKKGIYGLKGQSRKKGCLEWLSLTLRRPGVVQLSQNHPGLH